MNKGDVVYIYTMEYHSAVRKNEILPFAAARMDLEVIILSEVSQTKRQISYGITYMWNIKYDTNELIYKTETDSDIENKLMITKEELGGGTN